MDYNLIKVFVVLSQTCSLTKAAEVLGMTQPGISMALKKLKAEVGYELYARKGRGVELTAEGLYLAERFAQAESLLDITRTNVKPVIHCSESLLYQLEGKIDAHFLESPLSDEQLVGDLTSRKVNLVIDHLPRQSTALISEEIYQDQMVVVCRKDHPRIHYTLTAEQYYSEQHIALKMKRQSMSAFEYLQVGQSAQRNVVVETGSIASMMLLASEGDKLGSVSRSMFDRWGNKLGLTCFDFPFKFSPVEYHLIYHRRYLNDPVHRELRSKVKACF
ncbi:LysR family transcriptional regulator [Vibrio inusitatus NBRC 102082]|uniref:LysR family transcriptional regulator n=1 Tax=Vibrio inusitatus NBRC 102082 TaxID=1219070 RepID=A0A4Y3HRM8_9VIBR|nr:LysR family transcriptional regulator [Vibrio inusitatus]GEA49685.1 LysR family transcriptional regulator [Vibrio inusitatus NBRC 102082]